MPPITTASASAESTGGDAESSTTMVEEDSDDIKLDVGVDTDDPNTGVDPDGDMSGCDKVDFLFVIDNSGSMGPFQENLVTNFPGFINTIQETLDEAQDYHITVSYTHLTLPTIYSV